MQIDDIVSIVISFACAHVRCSNSVTLFPYSKYTNLAFCFWNSMSFFHILFIIKYRQNLPKSNAQIVFSHPKKIVWVTANITFDPIKEMRLSNQKRITNQFSILFSKRYNSLADLCQQLIHICDMFDFRDFLRHPHNQTQSMYQINSKVNDFFCYQIGEKNVKESVFSREEWRSTITTTTKLCHNIWQNCHIWQT